MDTFRRLMTVALIAGTMAGLGLAAIQHVTIVPLILRAEHYEHGAAHHDAGPAAAPAVEEWQPGEGAERTMYTVLGTALTGIGFAALLFGVASALELDLGATRGVLLGLAGFACCALAPAIGLPPRPPGAAAANLQAAQLWWVGTAVATAIGLWMIARAKDPGRNKLTIPAADASRRAALLLAQIWPDIPHSSRLARRAPRRPERPTYSCPGPKGSWPWRIAGAVAIAVPHLVGAPRPEGQSAVPADLSTTFAITSIATQAVFWLMLGAFGGWLYASTFRPRPRGAS